MQAQVGDRIVVESTALHRRRRVGEVVAVLGGPLVEIYQLRWNDGTVSVYCPGPDARIQTPDTPETTEATGPSTRPHSAR